MKHIFVVNPAAGKGKRLPALLSSITYACQEQHADYEIYHTTTVGDGTRFVTEYCESHADELLRFYACGGDGTMNEVVNGIVGHENAELAVIPVGTGNDFVKCFSNPDALLDIRRQLLGTAVSMDAIKFGRRYCANILNIGFDCEVVQKVAEIKRSALVPQGLAYPFGVVSVFTKPMGKHFKLLIDDEEVIDRELTLCAIGNGRFYGGGFQVTPAAFTNDGLLDLCVVDKVSRAKFVAIIPKYKDGKHLDENGKSLYPFIRYRKCRKVAFYSDEPMGFCADGEVFPHRKVVIEVVPNALRVVVPKGTRCTTLTEKPANTGETNSKLNMQNEEITL